MVQREATFVRRLRSQGLVSGVQSHADKKAESAQIASRDIVRLRARDPRGVVGRLVTEMSSYAEFLDEAWRLSTTREHMSEEEPYPVAVPHSRGRGEWAQWVREAVIPQHVLDIISKRYGSESWSANAGKRTRFGGGRSSPGPWRRPPEHPQPVAKVGGAKQYPMRGVGCGSRDSRPRSSGRAWALRMHSEGLQERRTPGQVSLTLHDHDIMHGSLP